MLNNEIRKKIILKKQKKDLIEPKLAYQTDNSPYATH
jgi:hypothetical protein